MQKDIIANMTNLADSGQDKFIENQTELARIALHEQGISYKFLHGEEAAYILAKVVTDLVDDGNFSKTTMDLIATLRINHPHSEDNANV